MPEDSTLMSRDLTSREVTVLKFIASKPRGTVHDEVQRMAKTWAVAEHMDELMNRFKLIEPLSDGHGGSKGQYIVSEAGRSLLKRLADGEAQIISDAEALRIDTHRAETEAETTGGDEVTGEPIETGAQGENPNLSAIPPAPGPNMIYDSGTRKWLTYAEAAKVFQAKVAPAKPAAPAPAPRPTPPVVSKTGRQKPAPAKKGGK